MRSCFHPALLPLLKTSVIRLLRCRIILIIKAFKKTRILAVRQPLFRIGNSEPEKPAANLVCDKMKEFILHDVWTAGKKYVKSFDMNHQISELAQYYSETNPDKIYEFWQKTGDTIETLHVTLTGMAHNDLMPYACATKNNAAGF